MKAKGLEAVEWLQGLPLHHFINNLTQPFGRLNLKQFMKQDFTFYGIKKEISIDSQ